MSRLEPISPTPFTKGQKLKASELNSIIGTINNIINYIRANEQYWIKDEAGGSNSITPLYSENGAQKIAKFYKNGEELFLYAPVLTSSSLQSGSAVSIVPAQIMGEKTKIATFNINGVPGTLYAPKSSQGSSFDTLNITNYYNRLTGIKIADIVFNGETLPLFGPKASSGGGDDPGDEPGDDPGDGPEYDDNFPGNEEHIVPIMVAIIPPLYYYGQNSVDNLQDLYKSWKIFSGDASIDELGGRDVTAPREYDIETINQWLQAIETNENNSKYRQYLREFVGVNETGTEILMENSVFLLIKAALAECYNETTYEITQLMDTFLLNIYNTYIKSKEEFVTARTANYIAKKYTETYTTELYPNGREFNIDLTSAIVTRDDKIWSDASIRTHPRFTKQYVTVEKNKADDIFVGPLVETNGSNVDGRYRFENRCAADDGYIFILLKLVDSSTEWFHPGVGFTIMGTDEFTGLTTLYLVELPYNPNIETISTQFELLNYIDGFAGTEVDYGLNGTSFLIGGKNYRLLAFLVRGHGLDLEDIHFNVASGTWTGYVN